MKRRIRRIRRALKRAGLYNAFHITLIAVLLTGFCVILFNVKEPEQEKEPEEMQAEVTQNPETMTQTAESIKDKYKVFDGMSEDWGSDDLEGFVFYELPEQYADKGYFPEKMQIYTRCLCKQNDVPYALVLAIIEHESGYEFDKVGDGGQSKGYMQIYEKWHTDRMERLNCTDLMNPYQNVRVGIDFLSYLLKKYGTVQDALAAYNYGEKGAREHLWSNGVYVYSYNSAIMQRTKEIEEVVGKRVLTGNRNQKTDISEKPRQQSRQRDSMTSCKSAENSLQSRKARSRCISSRFRERERPADGGRQRERLRICMKYLRQKTSSVGNTRAFSFTPT